MDGPNHSRPQSLLPVPKDGPRRGVAARTTIRGGDGAVARPEMSIVKEVRLLKEAIRHTSPERPGRKQDGLDTESAVANRESSLLPADAMETRVLLIRLPQEGAAKLVDAAENRDRNLAMGDGVRHAGKEDRVEEGHLAGEREVVATPQSNNRVGCFEEAGAVGGSQAMEAEWNTQVIQGRDRPHIETTGDDAPAAGRSGRAKEDGGLITVNLLARPAAVVLQNGPDGPGGWGGGSRADEHIVCIEEVSQEGPRGGEADTGQGRETLMKGQR